jgi:hypothetical protein
MISPVEFEDYIENTIVPVDRAGYGAYIPEYDMFVEVTENEFVPAFMIVESPDESPKSYLYAPERDFDEIDEGVNIIKEHFNK